MDDRIPGSCSLELVQSFTGAKPSAGLARAAPICSRGAFSRYSGRCASSSSSAIQATISSEGENGLTGGSISRYIFASRLERVFGKFGRGERSTQTRSTAISGQVVSLVSTNSITQRRGAAERTPCLSAAPRLCVRQIRRSPSYTAARAPCGSQATICPAIALAATV